MKKVFVILMLLFLVACNSEAVATIVPGELPAAEATAAVVQAPAAEATAVPPTEAPTDIPEPTAAPEEPTTAPEPTAAPEEPTAVPAPTFQIIGVANRDPAQAAYAPSLTAGTTAPGNTPTPWITWVENFSGDSRQVFVSELVDGALQPRGASLNIHTNVLADFPAISFTGENSAVPWVVWQEPSPGFGNNPNIFASRFNATSGLWIPAGQDRGSGEPSINSQTNRPAANTSLIGGSGDPAKPTSPWIAWEELGRLSNFTQIFVSKGVKDETGIGGFIWQQVGELRHNEEPTLNVDPFRHAFHPSIAFAETGNAVPWVAWYEDGAERPLRIFTARGVADANAPGGFKWVFTPACDPDETACALNVNPLKDAEDPVMVAGSVTPGEATVPWVVWPEIGPSGKFQIFVSRLDPSTRNSFVNVGGSLNIDQNQDAITPVMTFVGNVPYVSWLEDDGTGNFRVHLRHLASDPQTGSWVVDSPATGFDQDPARNNSGLRIAAGTDILYLAWVEGDPATEASQVVLAQFQP